MFYQYKCSELLCYDTEGPAGNSQNINQLGVLQWKFEIQVKTIFKQ